MDTTKLKSFATRARKVLIEGVFKKMLSLGFNEDGDADDFPRQISGATLFRGEQLEESFYDRWIALHEALQSKGVREVCESVAYTWFNRFMAIRIMYKNGFIAPVLTFDNPEIRVPHVVTEARSGRIPAMDNKDRMRLLAVINDASKTYEQFNILIVAVSHSTPLINNCFGAINDYTELLLPRDILDENGFVDMLNNSDSYITDENYHSTELLGWLYQFYISDRKAEVFKKGGKYNSEDIAPATQIFTPNWIVKYMVQNAVLPQIMSREELEENKDRFKYLVLPSDDDSLQEELRPYDEMRVGDLACGSGHILIECFNTMLEPLTQQLWSRTEAIKHMFDHTLIGIDIDTRAKQLASFALLLRACQEDSTFLDGEKMPRILDIAGIADFVKTQSAANELSNCPNHKVRQEIEASFKTMEDVDDLGSIMKFDISSETREWIMSRIENVDTLLAKTYNLILALTEKYDALIMNPPYMGSGSMNNILSQYVSEYYPLTKADLCTVFMDVCFKLIKNNGNFSMINQSPWSAKYSYIDYRKWLKDNAIILSYLDLGAGTFAELKGEVVQSLCFIIKKCTNNFNGCFYNLSNASDTESKEKEFLKSKDNPYIFSLSDIEAIPDEKICYWISVPAIKAFKYGKPLNSLYPVKKGLATGNDPSFLRYWYEVSVNDINFDCESLELNSTRWIPICKGGGYRKWYGNIDYVIDWEDNGSRLKSYRDEKGKLLSRPQNLSFMLKEAISYNIISSRLKGFVGRYLHQNLMMTDVAPNIYGSDIPSLLPLLNSVVGKYFCQILCPSFKYETGYVGQIPILPYETTEIRKLGEENIDISHIDWDAHETSWDFQENPIIYWTKNVGPISFTVCGEPAGSERIGLEEAVSMYKTEWEEKFRKLHENEEELNRRFIEIYGLQDELSPEVPIKDITILQQGELDLSHFTETKEYGIIDGVPTEITQTHFAWNDDVLMKQLISYAIGCMIGRYRLDKPGLAIAHPNPTDEELAPYSYNDSEFVIDDDAIIPIMPEDCPFDDNASIRISDFIGQVFGAENQIDSLNFMENALGKSLSEYMQRDFWKDHNKMYQKPIYWLFSSKGGAFKALVYMHRMDPFTVNKIRNNYLLRHIEFLKQKIEELKARQATLTRVERTKLARMQADLADCQEYEIRLHAVANQQIAIDLDNGVSANYALFGDVLAKIK